MDFPTTHMQAYIQEEWEHTATPTLYTSVHGSFIHHGRNVETPKGPPRAEWLNEMRPALRSDSEHSVVGRVQPPTARAAELSLERRRHGSPTRVPGVRLSTAHEPRRAAACGPRAVDGERQPAGGCRASFGLWVRAAQSAKRWKWLTRPLKVGEFRLDETAVRKC